MKRIAKFISSNPLIILLLALPFTLAAQLLGWSSVTIFILAAIGIIPLASYIGDATEDLASHTDPRLGALLNATLGNAAELIITITAVQAGLLELVKASITGSIIGNLLLVLGFSIVVGGVRYGVQTFNKQNAARNAILLVLAVVTLVIPSIFSQSIGGEGSSKVEVLSLGVAVIMLALYGFGLFDASKQSPLSHTLPESDVPTWTIGQSIAILALSTLGVVWLSESLVHVAEDVITGLGISEFFLGIILVPLIGNVAEHLVAVQMALKNKMDLSTEIAISSSLQIALFVAPLLVFISLALGHPLQIIFNRFELLALLTAVGISALVSADGESTWLEGVGLLAVYLILGLAFFLLV
ncbi:MAG TPA: calcium/proton exchanger [Anaerolineales bacterium]|jgi:Ca2+:H+ antiporter|nr:calcium/proton exchanger [Anaerolineales bacterium]